MDSHVLLLSFFCFFKLDNICIYNISKKSKKSIRINLNIKNQQGKQEICINRTNYTYEIIGWYLLEKIQTLPSMREKFFRKTKNNYEYKKSISNS